MKKTHSKSDKVIFFKDGNPVYVPQAHCYYLIKPDRDNSVCIASTRKDFIRAIKAGELDDYFLYCVDGRMLDDMFYCHQNNIYNF